jgi:hypothetical protein
MIPVEGLESSIDFGGWVWLPEFNSSEVSSWAIVSTLPCNGIDVYFSDTSFPGWGVQSLGKDVLFGRHRSVLGLGPIGERLLRHHAMSLKHK